MTQYIDISVQFKEGTDGNVYPHPLENLPTYCGHKCTASDVLIKSHCGTYYETSSHVFRDGKDTIDIPVRDFFLPVSILKLSGSGGITAKEMEDAGRHVQCGDALLIHSVDKKRFFELEAVHWMISQKIKLLGADLIRYDTGFTNPTGIFIDLFKAEIPIIANIEHIEDIPVPRAQLVVLPLKIDGVGTVPCRAVVIIE